MATNLWSMSSMCHILFLGLLKIVIHCSGQSVDLTIPASDSVSIRESNSTKFVCEATTSFDIVRRKFLLTCSWYMMCDDFIVALEDNINSTTKSFLEPFYTTTTSRLIYTGTRHDNGCKIRCKSTSAKGDDVFSKRRVKLNIQYKAVITSFTANGTSHDHKGFPEGSTVRLACVVDSNPGSKIAIRKNGRQVAHRSNTTVLRHTINNVTWKDAATYTCVAYNRYTKDDRATKGLQLFVRCKPRPVNSPQNQTIIKSLGDNVTMALQVRAYPLPHFTWWTRTGESDTGWGVWTQVLDKTSISSSSPLHSALTIGNIRERDFGHYKVMATNSEGFCESYFSIRTEAVETTRDLPPGSAASPGVYWGVGVCLVAILAAVGAIVGVVVVRNRKTKDTERPVEEITVTNQYEGLAESNRENWEYDGLEQGTACATNSERQVDITNQYEDLSDTNKESREYAGLEPGPDYINETEEHEYDYVT